MKFSQLISLLSFFLIFGFPQSRKGALIGQSGGTPLSDYPIHPVDIRHIKLTDEFWLPIVKTVQERTIDYALDKCQQEGRFENFLIAGGMMEGEVKGYMPFDDTDVYKIIEGASNSLISAPNEELEILLDSLVAIIKTGQEEDGYLTTWRTIDAAKPPAKWVKVIEGKRWESLESSHELYNAGHLYEAASVHYLATGKRNFLDIETVQGHQIIETGLIKLYRITGNQKYLDLAKYFLDGRGDYSSGRSSFGPYAQDHLPVIEQDEVVGHAVRAVYMYAAMTDIAAIYSDKQYMTAVEKFWDNMVSKKIYITGGIGARHNGESFGDNYELPNKTAYNETCASIGSVYWNHRLFLLSGDVKYYDIIERTLYNGLISGLALDGVHFFYPNALESDGVYAFNKGSCTRSDWFDCSCCPTNLIRFLPAVQGLIYSKIEDTLFVNLYVSNEADLDLDGKQIRITQQTSYPWNGKVKIGIETKEPTKFVLKLRAPGWTREEVLPSNLYAYRNTMSKEVTLTLNGLDEKIAPEDGYYLFDREWSGKEVVTLDFPVEVREVIANAQVEENRGKVALEAGPVVYAVEEMDNKDSFDHIHLTTSQSYKVEMQPNLLKGVNVLKVNNEDVEFQAIPYYAWSNRGVGRMRVWLSEAD
jgi:DUF1680 family protein